jgi:preprotein translocase SecE subunit
MTKISPVNYFSSVVAEGKKIIWPGRQIVLRHTLLVVVVVVVATLVFAGLDYGLQKLVILAIQ